jgi:hypothetical protein
LGLDACIHVDGHELLGDQLAGILASGRVADVVPKRRDVRLEWE